MDASTEDDATGRSGSTFRARSFDVTVGFDYCFGKDLRSFLRHIMTAAIHASVQILPETFLA
jgi:hypothetical protein